MAIPSSTGNVLPFPGGDGQQNAGLPLPQNLRPGDTPAPTYEEDEEPPDVNELRKQYTDYVTIKYREIIESRVALQYYHNDQWTEEQLKILEARGQPPITFNFVGPAINGTVGVLEKLRGDPKAYGAKENDERGAELATTCIRYALEKSRWAPAETEALRMGACVGFVVAEMAIVPGDKGNQDPDIDIQAVDGTTFFYDPRSMKLDFSDARFMGVSKLFTRDEFEEMFPGEVDPETGKTESRWEAAMGSVDDTGQTQFDLDRYYLWAQGRERLRLVEHWYRSKGEWRYAFYAGGELLQSGLSPFVDEKGQTTSRYDAFAINIDNLGYHYGFVRNMVGPQDSINQHRSKSVWIMNTNQVLIHRSALGGDQPDIETVRREAARPDGVTVWDGAPELKPQFNQLSQQLAQHTQYYQDAVGQFQKFAPVNPAVASGGGPADISGRSLAIQQQAGLAQLGPFLSQWRGWKLRLYRKIWGAQQRYWTAERVLRVTNDQGLASYVQINKLQLDEWGRPLLVNAIGQVDVDILIDEGPDTTNIMGDVNDTLIALANNKIPIPPQVIIETSNLPRSKKTELNQMLSQTDPQTDAAKQAALDQVKAQTAETMSKVHKNQADIGIRANKAQIDAGKAATDVGKTTADTMKSRAQAIHTLALAHGETAKTHATHTGAAIDAFQAMNPPEPAGQAARPAQPAQPAPQPQQMQLPLPPSGGIQSGLSPMPPPPTGVQGGPPVSPVSPLGQGGPPPSMMSAPGMVAPSGPAPVGPPGMPPTSGGPAGALNPASAGPAGAPPGTPSSLMSSPGGPPLQGGPPPDPMAPLPGGPMPIPPGFDAPRTPPPDQHPSGLEGAKLAPDGHHYIYAPHPKGNWRRVVWEP